MKVPKGSCELNQILLKVFSIIGRQIYRCYQKVLWFSKEIWDSVPTTAALNVKKMNTHVNRFVLKELLSITNSYTLTELIMHKWCTLWSCESSVKNAVNLVALFCFAIWYISTHQTFLNQNKCLKQTLSVQYSPDFSKDGYLGCGDFSINNPQNKYLVMWLLTGNITFWVKSSIKKLGDCMGSLLHIKYSQSIKINIGPINGETVVPATHRSTVLYWRLSDFNTSSSLWICQFLSATHLIYKSKICAKKRPTDDWLIFWLTSNQSFLFAQYLVVAKKVVQKQNRCRHCTLVILTEN